MSVVAADFDRFHKSGCPKDALITYLAICSYDYNPQQKGIITAGQRAIAYRVGLGVDSIKRHTALLKKHGLILHQRRFKSSARTYIWDRCDPREWAALRDRGVAQTTSTSEGVVDTTSTGVEVALKVAPTRSQGVAQTTYEVAPTTPQNGKLKLEEKGECSNSFSSSPHKSERDPERLADIQARAIDDLLAKEPEMTQEDAVDLVSQKAERRQAAILAERTRRQQQKEEATHLAKNPNELAAKLPKQLRQAYLSRQKKIP